MARLLCLVALVASPRATTFALAPPRLSVEVLRSRQASAFDPVAHFEGLARGDDEGVAVVDGFCEEEVASARVRVLIDGEAAFFGAGDMSEDERRRKAFDVGGPEDADRVWAAATRLRERLGGIAAGGADFASFPGVEATKPASSAGFYGEAELENILAMHETLRDDGGLDDAGSASPFDLHDVVRGMVEDEPAPPKPASSAGFYAEDELKNLLAMHETLKEEGGLDDEGSGGAFDLHDIVRGMIEDDP